MTRRFGVTAGLVFFGTLAFAASGAARQDGAWVLLGQRQVNDRADHDVVVVTGARGDFHAIKITVQRASVDFHRVTVHFGNGSKQEVDMRHTIPAGGETRVIDLEGSDRVINRVEFWYDANTIRGRRAQIRLWARR